MSELTDMNDSLCVLAKRWIWDGDYMRCKSCKRPHIASKSHMPFLHEQNCKYKNVGDEFPWRQIFYVLSPIAQPAAVEGENIKSSFTLAEIKNGETSGIPPCNIWMESCAGEPNVRPNFFSNMQNWWRPSVTNFHSSVFTPLYSLHSLSLIPTVIVNNDTDLHNFITHRDNWQEAIKERVEHYVDIYDGVSAAYWQHELNAFNNAMKAFDVNLANPSAVVAIPDLNFTQ